MGLMLSCLVLLGSALAETGRMDMLEGASGPDSLVIGVHGQCPGRIVVNWEGAAPNEWAGLWFSQSRGEVTLPQGPCGHTVLGLGTSGLRLVRIFRSGPDGAGELGGRAPTAACGGFVQMIVQDGIPCTTSNVVQIPQ